MKLEKQVVSLELAKRMVELGFRQESYFTWVLRHGRWSVWDEGTMSECETGMEKRKVCAYTVAELLLMVPAREKTAIDKYGNGMFYLQKMPVKGYSPIYINGTVDSFDFYADTAQDAIAKLLIHLAEQKLIDPNPPTQ